jgi:hypothetical protein
LQNVLQNVSRNIKQNGEKTSEKIQKIACFAVSRKEVNLFTKTLKAAS